MVWGKCWKANVLQNSVGLYEAKFRGAWDWAHHQYSNWWWEKGLWFQGYLYKDTCRWHITQTNMTGTSSVKKKSNEYGQWKMIHIIKLFWCFSTMVAESANFWISRKKTSIWKNSISMSSPAKPKTGFEKFRFQGKEKPQKHKVSEVLYAFSRPKRLSLCEQKLSFA